MSSSVLHPPAHLPPNIALQLSQEAPSILRASPPISVSFSDPLSLLTSLISRSESADLWISYENLMISCLRTGDDASAEVCLERLSKRFGSDNERVLGLSALYKEATASSDEQLENTLKEYDGLLSNDPTNMPIAKRRVALLKSLGRVKESIEGLNILLDMSPTDAEAWSELAELYVSQGLYTQGIFALEEVLLIAPNAWNMNARLGELQYKAALATNGGNVGEAERLLAEALRRFCRSTELCDDYLRGFYGIKLTTTHLLENTPKAKQTRDADEASLPDSKTLQALNQKSTEKMAEIVRHYVSQGDGWEGYDRAEIIAARALLNLDNAPITR